MAKRVRAVFDGKVLHPDDPAGLTPNARYVLTVEREEDGEKGEETGLYQLTEILGLATDMGVADLSIRHSWYAHGGLENDQRGP